MKRSTLLVSAVAAATLGSGPARAGETCYGFSGLQDGRVFAIGETFQAEHLQMHVRHYLRDGSPQNPDGHFIKVQSTALAGSTASEKSELYIYGATMQIVPRQPVAQISLRLAENKGNQLGKHANVQINGRVHEVAGGLRDLDGRELGDGSGGLFRATVKLRPPQAGSDWTHGTLQLRALSGQIASFAIGSTPMVVDDVCLTPNAP